MPLKNCISHAVGVTSFIAIIFAPALREKPTSASPAFPADVASLLRKLLSSKPPSKGAALAVSFE
jgi:hypothetical protein